MELWGILSTEMLSYAVFELELQCELNCNCLKENADPNKTLQWFLFYFLHTVK